MIIQCNSCSRKFIVRDIDIPKAGRMVQCGYCSVTWHQMPVAQETKKLKQKTKVPPVEVDENPSVESIKASAGKTYKFLGSQWAELFPYGKTGLFAKRKIGKVLDKITGRKIESKIEKRKKKIKEVDPSAENFNEKNQLPDIYKPREGLGFFGYIFLIIIVGFSIVGVLTTFEKDLLIAFPAEAGYIFELLNQQSEYFTETFKNIIVIIKDLVNSY